MKKVQDSLKCSFLRRHKSYIFSMKFISLFILISFFGCAPKSEVTPLFEPISLKESHGDGKYAVFTVKLPLSDNSIDTYDSPIDPTTGVSRIPLLGDMLRFVTQATFNFGAVIGFGKTYLTIKQPLPDLDSPYINSISVKRVFFHIDQKKIDPDVRLNLWDKIRNLIRGTTKLNFNFIRQMRLNMRVSKEDEPSDYIPEIIEDTPLTPIARGATDIMEFLRYDRNSRSTVLNEATATNTVVIYSPQPVRLRRFIRQNTTLSAYVKNMEVINKSLFVELKQDFEQDASQRIDPAMYRELFGRETPFESKVKEFTAIFEKESEGNAQVEVLKMVPCASSTCMDIKVNNQNLLPLIKQGNRLNIETMIDASRVPPRSFQLKGFIEFEIKLDLPL